MIAYTPDESRLVFVAGDSGLLIDLRDARAAGIRLTINLIPNLPTTTRDEALRGLADLEAVADCMDRVSVFDFEATRSSNVGRDPAAFAREAHDRILQHLVDNRGRALVLCVSRFVLMAATGG